ncbi:TetR family transcriptional regulator C-terminal domain-containing protein [Arthrobacter sp. SD76]|uniref:TetR family transcriptional regulator C-terminal domain-containing protein n=1 Tax=Arthrobacter sp. SD76 TaxID=3415007 RepID=UPI003C775F68
MELISTYPGLVELHCTLLAEATTPDHPAHSFFVERYDRTRQSLVAAFEAAERDGRLLDGVNPHHAAASTLALLDGLQLQWLLNPREIDMPSTLAAHFARIVDLTDRRAATNELA